MYSQIKYQDFEWWVVCDKMICLIWASCKVGVYLGQFVPKLSVSYTSSIDPQYKFKWNPLSMSSFGDRRYELKTDRQLPKYTFIIF